MRAPVKFRKKPVIVEAMQLRWDTWTAMCTFTRDTGAHGVYVDKLGKITEDTNARLGLAIQTLEGVMLAVEGDWIIRGVKGEFYPCRPDIFEATYEPLSLAEEGRPDDDIIYRDGKAYRLVWQDAEEKGK